MRWTTRHGVGGVEHGRIPGERQRIVPLRAQLDLSRGYHPTFRSIDKLLAGDHSGPLSVSLHVSGENVLDDVRRQTIHHVRGNPGLNQRTMKFRPLVDRSSPLGQTLTLGPVLPQLRALTELELRHITLPL